MHEITGATAVNGHFVDGTSTQSGTIVSADWLNTVQDEICNLITSTGIALNSDTSDDKKQLIAAINKINENLSSALLGQINLKLSIDDFNNTLKTLVNKTEYQSALDDIAWCKNEINIIIGKAKAL